MVSSRAASCCPPQESRRRQYHQIEATIHFYQDAYLCCVLRRLYVMVITTIRGFGDLFWSDMVAQMDTMNDTVLGFQAQAKKLPKVTHFLKTWHLEFQC